MFTSEDLQQIQAQGLDEARIRRQVEIFRQGRRYQKLDRPCTLGDGIHQIRDEDHDELLTRYRRAQAKGRCTKMTPASGAASRMFKHLATALSQLKRGEQPQDPAYQAFVAGLERFAFFPELQGRLEAKGVAPSDDLFAQATLETLLEDMNYASLPKGLLKFHRIPNGDRTPAQEHLHEAVDYLRDDERQARLHFTVSPEHYEAFERHMSQSASDLEGTLFQVTYSEQKSSTDTIAVDHDYQPFRNPDGSLLFRPGGHGALIGNLEDLQGDLVFIKNIDNVTQAKHQGDTLLWKKLLGGFLLKLQERIFGYLELLAKDAYTSDLGADILSFVQTYIGIQPTIDPKSDGAGEALGHILNRPLRVCGMVRNQGEPGGGPFWVRGEEGLSMQIVEGAQIDRNEMDQSAILEASTHFNPVDIVCGLRDREGAPFALKNFVDENTYFIAEKSKDGKPLLALERPGLWNGAMAFWNTCFVETPLSTFSPVKTVNDLLREAHQ